MIHALNQWRIFMYEDILIAGFGGQGIIFTGKLLAYAGLKEGREVGTVLKTLFDKVLENPELNKREILTNLIKGVNNDQNVYDYQNKRREKVCSKNWTRVKKN